MLHKYSFFIFFVKYFLYCIIVFTVDTKKILLYLINNCDIYVVMFGYDVYDLRKLYKSLWNKEYSSDTLNTIVVHSDNIIHNVTLLRSLHPYDAFFPVVKSNWYWHGCREIAIILEQTDCEMIAVDSYPEYQIVRDYTTKYILIMWELTNTQKVLCDPYRCRFVVNSIQSLIWYTHIGVSISIHLFINTGMNREWISIQDLDFAIKILQQNSQIVVEWVMSHLSDGDALDNINTEQQYRIFEQACKILNHYNITPRYRHLWASAGMVTLNNTICNAWRSWLALYGYSPLPVDHLLAYKIKGLKPSLSIYTTITGVQVLQPWDGVSYSKSWTANHQEYIGVIPFWYAEWLMRSLSNKIFFGPYQQIWNICMNYTTIRLWVIDTQDVYGRHIVLLDGLSDTCILQQRADEAETIVYELLVRLAPNIKRIII